ncbi:hypothetical protein SteCoe_30092 [Stentor coeruleus]|uniref:Protein kinase domain-containing protein n=1 Tax=Stentor coeruleus TaxID=5963 RepID=A0A1R2B4F3_9CILI|nr:hypothetical protein SteCoe_30092 [Stentor coeruleus]
MESIFTCTGIIGFWSPYIIGCSPTFPLLSLKDILNIKSSGETSNLSVQLCGTYLVQIDQNDNPIKYTNLQLKTFEPFIEENTNGNQYGFYIQTQAFYTRNEKILDIWINALKKICILTNIDDDYVLIKIIGKGSTSIVYLAESTNNSSQVSIKCIKKSSIKNFEILVNIANEIKILQKINHENICRLYYVYEDKDNLYLVMEYLPYGDLLNRLNDKEKFTEEDSAKFMGKMLLTLEFLHKQNIVHRDLKLENILMTGPDNDNFKIIDFGLAYMNENSQNKKCGSPGYVAPEILRDEDYDSKIDIFSSGVILYVTIYGKHPFEAKNLNKTLQKNVECHVKTNKSVSKIASDVIKLMMHPDPFERPSASQLLEVDWFGQREKIVTLPSLITSVNSVNPQVLI